MTSFSLLRTRNLIQTVFHSSLKSRNTRGLLSGFVQLQGIPNVITFQPNLTGAILIQQEFRKHTSKKALKLHPNAIVDRCCATRRCPDGISSSVLCTILPLECRAVPNKPAPDLLKMPPITHFSGFGLLQIFVKRAFTYVFLGSLDIAPSYDSLRRIDQCDQNS
jgi:hypothetical protein